MALQVSSETSTEQMSSANLPSLYSGGLDADGEPASVTLITAALLQVVKFCNFQIDADQVRELAAIVYADFGYLNAGELKLFCHRVKTGKYNHKKNISPAILLEFFGDFASECLTARATIFGIEGRKGEVITAPTGSQLQVITDPRGKILWQEPDPLDPDPAKRPVSDEAFEGLKAQLARDMAMAHSQWEREAAERAANSDFLQKRKLARQKWRVGIAQIESEKAHVQSQTQETRDKMKELEEFMKGLKNQTNQ